MSRRAAYLKQKDFYKRKKTALKIRFGKGVEEGLGIFLLYDMDILEELYYSNRFNEMWDYLWPMYQDFDSYKSYMKAGYKDPCLNYCLSITAYFKNEKNKEVIDLHWRDIMFNAFKRFFRTKVRMFEPELGLRFGTFFQKMFPLCFQSEFLEYVRPEVKEKNAELAKIFFPISDIDESEMQDNEDIQLISVEQMEFLTSLQPVKIREIHNDSRRKTNRKRSNIK